MQIAFLMVGTATDTRLLLRKIATYCIFWFANCLKNFKRQKCMEQETDLQRCQGRDKLERNKEKTVKKKGGKRDKYIRQETKRREEVRKEAKKMVKKGTARGRWTKMKTK